MALNVTVAVPGDAGTLTIYPSTDAQPGTWSTSFRSGQTRANNAVVGLGTDGGIRIYGGFPSGSTDVILDVTGYFE